MKRKEAFNVLCNTYDMKSYYVSSGVDTLSVSSDFGRVCADYTGVRVNREDPDALFLDAEDENAVFNLASTLQINGTIGMLSELDNYIVSSDVRPTYNAEDTKVVTGMYCALVIWLALCNDEEVDLSRDITTVGPDPVIILSRDGTIDLRRAIAEHYALSEYAIAITEAGAYGLSTNTDFITVEQRNENPPLHEISFTGNVVETARELLFALEEDCEVSLLGYTVSSTLYELCCISLDTRRFGLFCLTVLFVCQLSNTPVDMDNEISEDGVVYLHSVGTKLPQCVTVEDAHKAVLRNFDVFGHAVKIDGDNFTVSGSYGFFFCQLTRRSDLTHRVLYHESAKSPICDVACALRRWLERAREVRYFSYDITEQCRDMSNEKAQEALCLIALIITLHAGIPTDTDHAIESTYFAGLKHIDLGDIFKNF